MKKKSQRQRVLQALENREIVSNYHCSRYWTPAILRVGGIIHVLREEGYDIVSKDVVTSEGTKTVHYELVEEKKTQANFPFWEEDRFVDLG